MTEKLFLFVSGSQSIFDSATPQAERIKGITNGFIVAASVMLLLVIALTIYISVKYRAKKSSAEPKQTNGSVKLEALMVSVPLALVIFFFFWSVNTMNAVLPEVGNNMPGIVITAHQWWWQASYPGTKVTTANEIHLPAGKKILMQLNSADVIHDWWVPSLGGKMDMIPGRVNYLWVTISKPGIYEGSCSEFCGLQHAWMRIRVVAQSPEDYDKWLMARAANAVPPADTQAIAGAAIFMKATCGDCHTVRGTTANGTEGPDLTHFGSRQTMLAGMLDNNAENVNKWLSDPQKVKPGAHMPRFIFSKESVGALAVYVEQLK